LNLRDTSSLPTGRLAPSPTGAQHVGNARTYLLAWLSARSQGGRVLLRIEDIDSPRIKAGASKQAIIDLRWFGLDWDEGPDCGGAVGPYVQTERLETYQAALEKLRQAERVYPCSCTRKDVEEAASAPHLGLEGPVYSGRCAGRSAADANQSNALPFAWRFRTSPTPVCFEDHFAGPQSVDVASELGDFVIARADRQPAYQLAVVVDDHAMGVTEVLRGDDLLPSASRQLQLYSFFGWKAPSFVHVPLVIGPDGRRLAKRHGDTRLATLREQGCTPERLVGLLAWSSGLIDRPEPVAARELISHFTLAQLPREPFVFTPQMQAELIASGPLSVNK
jgi:glutamyl-tRNA synthetase